MAIIPLDRLSNIFRDVLLEAAKSIPEDDRVHPYVGALLTDLSGRVLVRAHRGERPGAHAEYLLLERAREAGVSLRESALFVTLEPCTKRGRDKIPCALRIAEAQIPLIFIGTLDPN